MNYLSAPDFPTDTKGTEFMYPGGYIPGGDLSKYQAIKSFGDDYFGKGVEESVKHSWYTYSKEGPLHPYKGETTPHYTDFQDDGKYSWLKAPTFYGKRAQVGPLAAVLNAVAAGHQADHRLLSPRCSTRCRRWLAPRSASMRCTRPSAATPPARSAAR